MARDGIGRCAPGSAGLRDAGEMPRGDGRVGLNVATYMAWQQRGSASSYNSTSGHNIGVGGYTNKILLYAVLFKRCRLCETAMICCKPVGSHDCPKNHDVFSKSMKPISIVSLATTFYRDDVSPSFDQLKHGESGVFPFTPMYLHNTRFKYQRTFRA